ncbi:hypothetical protein DQ04_11041000, partial [Trypanosoma grayi]|uniref:hypothetical protein n=1 Tax=Trypanosoma grayi TaxID=71804 RepID=UPI0004F3FC27
MLGDCVFEWDVRELQRARTSCTAGAVVYGALPMCFKWTPVDALPTAAVETRQKKATPSDVSAGLRHFCRRVGYTAWVCDNRFAMIDGGIYAQPETTTTAAVSQSPRPPSSRRQSNRTARRWRGRLARRVLEPSAETVVAVAATSGGGESSVPDVATTLLCYDLKQHSWSVTCTTRDETGDGAEGPRVFHSAAVVGDKVWCFGGCSVATARGTLSPLCNVLKCLHLPARQWSTVTPLLRLPSRALHREPAAPLFAVRTPLASSPPPLACHTAVAWDAEMYVFGGLREEGGTLVPSDALYAFHTRRVAW